jgi:hypothetical protein
MITLTSLLLAAWLVLIPGAIVGIAALGARRHRRDPRVEVAIRRSVFPCAAVHTSRGRTPARRRAASCRPRTFVRRHG